MNLSPAQQRAIDHRGTDLLLAASAGSGKTEVLARRVVSILSDAAQPCGVHELLVVTFTRAAAAEMRARIARLLQRALDSTSAGDDRRRLNRQLILLDAAEITTIDGWCGRIVRDHAAELGVDPRFTTLGGPEAASLRQQVLDATFETVYGADTPLRRQLEHWLQRGPSPDDEPMRQMVAALSRFREHLVNPMAWMDAVNASTRAPQPKAVLAAALRGEMDFQRGELEKMRRGLASGEEAPFLGQYAAALTTWSDQLAQPEALVGVLEDVASWAGGRGSKRDHPLARNVRECWFKKRLLKRWAPDDIAARCDRAGDAADYLDMILMIEDQFHHRLRDEKLRLASYEFADVQRMALDLLGVSGDGQSRAPTALARRLQGRYAHVLVDECQDVSPVQMTLLDLVRRPAPHRGGFLVGDLKQSIYGFREAEPRLMAERMQAYRDGGDGVVQYLSDNYRSHPDVLAAINDVAEALFEPALGGVSFAAEERLRAGRHEIDNPDLAGEPRVTLDILEGGDEPAPDDDLDTEAIAREAQLAAQQIRDLLARGVRVPDRGPTGEPRLRPLRPADIAVLLRGAKVASAHVAQTLRANGVRCVAAGREALLDTLEVQDVIGVLRLLVNRRDDIAMAAYLRGPLVGLQPRELLEIRTAADLERRNAPEPQPPLRFSDAVERAAQRGGERGAAVAWALNRLEQWAAMAREQSVGVLVRQIVRDGELIPFAAALVGGAQRVAMLEALQHFAVAFDRPAGGVAEFLDALARLDDADQAPQAATPVDDDAVRIMTIHASKGLEFPVVFLLGAGVRFNCASAQSPLLTDAQLGAGISVNDRTTRSRLVSAEHAVISDAVRRRLAEEELRLTYVAMTRARERLHIIGSTRKPVWNETLVSHGGRGNVPLIDKLDAGDRLRWLVMAIASRRLDVANAGGQPTIAVRTHAAGGVSVTLAHRATPQSAPVDAGLTDADRAWVDETIALVTMRAPAALARFPAAMSVSRLKRAVRPSEEPTHRLGPERLPEADFAPPTFVQPARQDGRAIGDAMHAFLQHADFSCLASVARLSHEMSALAARGLLSPEQLALLDREALLWLGQSELGGLLLNAPRARVRRELAFAYAAPLPERGEFTLVRGVVDCLIETPAGLVIVDYKTDAPRDEADMRDRIAGYSIQLQTYGEALATILKRPVVRRVLAFLRRQRIVEVPAASTPIGALLSP